MRTRHVYLKQIHVLDQQTIELEFKVRFKVPIFLHEEQLLYFRGGILGRNDVLGKVGVQCRLVRLHKKLLSAFWYIYVQESKLTP